MTIKDTSKFSSWFFYMIDPYTNGEIRIPAGPTPSGGIHQLVHAVITQMNEFDRVSNNSYSAKARSRAAELNITFEQYMTQVVHHQLCLRNSHIAGLCYSNGIGDSIHELLSGVDKVVDKLPEALKDKVKKVIQKITPSRTSTLGGCSVCGGTRSFSSKKDNLGRAGRLNE